jgi:hypothetical protein
MNRYDILLGKPVPQESREFEGFTQVESYKPYYIAPGIAPNISNSSGVYNRRGERLRMVDDVVNASGGQMTEAGAAEYIKNAWGNDRPWSVFLESIRRFYRNWDPTSVGWCLDNLSFKISGTMRP